MTSTIDTIRAIATYTSAVLISVGGLVALVVVTEMPPDTRTIVAAFVGGAMTFMWQQETQTRTARQTNTAQQAGAIAHANGLAGVPPPPMPADH